MSKNIVLLILICFSTISFASDKPLELFSMGSCNKSSLPQPLWPIISSHNPELFLWTGDVVYLDTTDLRLMKQVYQEQESIQNYIDFKKTTPIIGTWDDHDFGMNNIGKEYPKKVESQKLFLDFLDEPKDSPRRKQEGVYATYTYGPLGQEARFILLDTRYHREKPGRPHSDVLGDEQWEWLEDTLKNNTAQVTFIVSSISVMSDSMPQSEEWANFKWAKAKLFHLLRKHKTKGTMFLTGDRHFSGHLKGRIKGRAYYELMSSGMTHNKKSAFTAKIMKFFYGKDNTYFKRNFTNIELNWDSSPIELKFKIIGVDNVIHREKLFKLVNGNSWELHK